jgi:hypothetical protein
MRIDQGIPTNVFVSAHRGSILALAMLPMLTLFGCGGPNNRAAISGTVRLNGQPLANGSISFVPAEGNVGPSSGGIITDGKYAVSQARGVAVGKNRVGIRSMVKTGRKINIGRGSLEDEWQQVVPAKYNEQSELVHDVPPGSMRLDFDLKGEPPR